MKIAITKDPDIDFFIGFIGGDIVPTKQDKFEPVKCKAYEIDKKGVRTLITDYDFYKKKKSVNKLKEFEEKFRKQISDNLKPEHPYKKPEQLEVLISVSMDVRRLGYVDVDNLSKAILDCFNGLVYEDDSQVVSLYANKICITGFNGLLVGIRRIDNKDSWFKGIKFAYLQKINE